MTGKIYKHTSPSNKLYIGQTIQKLNKRWNHGNGYKSLKGKNTTPFFRAIQKYGWDSFKHEVIDECSSEIIGEREQYWIKHYKELGYKLYNRNDGGKGNIGYRFSEESKRKISEATKGERNPMYGVPYSEERRKKQSELMKGKPAWNKGLVGKQVAWNKGKTLTNEHRHKISASVKVSVTEAFLKMCSERQKGKTYMLGKKHSKESIEKMKQAHKQRHLLRGDENGWHWFNNGTKSVMAHECPIGFVVGRLYHPKIV